MFCSRAILCHKWCLFLIQREAKPLLGVGYCLHFLSWFRTVRFTRMANHCMSYFLWTALMGSRIIATAAYCNKKLLAHLYINNAQNTSDNWIIRLLVSLSCRPKVILLSSGHSTTMYNHRPYFEFLPEFNFPAQVTFVKVKTSKNV
jgi:hypothetical protein